MYYWDKIRDSKRHPVKKRSADPEIVRSVANHIIQGGKEEMKQNYAQLSNGDLLDLYFKRRLDFILDVSEVGATNQRAAYTAAKEEVIARMKNGGYSLADAPVGFFTPTYDLRKDLTDAKLWNNPTALPVIREMLMKELKMTSLSNKDKATLYIIKDSSGSMGLFENAMTEAVMYWYEVILKELYDKVEVKFIKFHTKATSVSGVDFYKAGDAGGTMVSTGLAKANEMINQNGHEHNYVVLASDGDNLTSDGEGVLRCFNDLYNKTSKLCYLEINQYNRSSTLKNTALKKVTSSVKQHVVTDTNGVIDALVSFWK